ncbi:MAG TPA: hypothetical protein VGR97_07485 [Candidatus Acidoferrales bacterium]|nr:hypothetical protein [Candidatus Acidoferrales bacterium]
MNSRRIRQWKILVVVSFALLFFALVDLVMWEQRGEILADSAQKTGSALVDFAEQRAELSFRGQSESFEHYQQRLSAENAETQSLYAKRYSLEVKRLRRDLARRGLTAPVLDEFYQRPGSTIAVREIGSTLFDMGVWLSVPKRSAQIKEWLRYPV